MASDERTIRAHLEEIEKKLNELKEKEAILLSLKTSYERWLAIETGTGQTYPQKPIANQEEKVTTDQEDSKQSLLSLRAATLKVLQEAYPQALHASEIWEKVQALGAKSQAKRPATALDFSLHALMRRTGLVEKVAPATWRWAGKEKEEGADKKEEESEEE